MSTKVEDFIKKFDFSQSAVSLRVNRQDSYASFAGGLCSLIMVIAMCSLGFMDLYKVFVTPQRFKERVETSYLQVANNTDTFSLASQDFIPAI